MSIVWLSVCTSQQSMGNSPSCSEHWMNTEQSGCYEHLELIDAHNELTAFNNCHFCLGVCRGHIWSKDPWQSWWTEVVHCTRCTAPELAPGPSGVSEVHWTVSRVKRVNRLHLSFSCLSTSIYFAIHYSWSASSYWGHMITCTYIFRV